MELLVIAVVAIIGYLVYRSGKRTGSRKGYNVGRQHGRRRKNQR